MMTMRKILTLAGAWVVYSFLHIAAVFVPTVWLLGALVGPAEWPRARWRDPVDVGAALRRALMDQIRATAHAAGQRPDVIALMERRGTLINDWASPSARAALAAARKEEEP